MTSAHSIGRHPDRAILLALPPDTPDCGDISSLGVPALLLPLLGKPMLQRAVEQLVRHGCRHIDIALGDDAAAVKAFLGGGERWGCRLSYHYLAAHEPLGRFMRRLNLSADSHYWLADALQVPETPLPVFDGPNAGVGFDGRPLCFADGNGSRWSGWGLFSGAWLLARQAPPCRECLQRQVLSDVGLAPLRVTQPLSAATLNDFLASSRRLLAARAQDEHTIGRGSRIHPSAHINAPVFIGAQVKIAAGAVIGPNAVIESGSFIDFGTHLRDCVVLADTYAGKELDLNRIIARGNLLAHVALNIVTEVRDANLLAELPRPDMAIAPMQRALAAALRLLLLPLYALCLWQLRDRPETGPIAVAISRPHADPLAPQPAYVTLVMPGNSTDTASRQWLRHFSQTFYPGLREVMRGCLQIVGPQLRTPHEVRELPDAWRRVYAEYRCGLLSDALLQDAAHPCSEDHFASDALAGACQNDTRASLSLLRRYLARVMHALYRNPPDSPQPLPTRAPAEEQARAESITLNQRPI